MEFILWLLWLVWFYSLLSVFSTRVVCYLTSNHREILCCRNVYKLVNYLQESEMPHNLFITRGSSFDAKRVGQVRDCVRLYVWARKPVYGKIITVHSSKWSTDVFSVLGVCRRIHTDRFLPFPAAKLYSQGNIKNNIGHGNYSTGRLKTSIVYILIYYFGY